LVRETALAPGHLIQPLFVVPEGREPEPVAAMPGVFRCPVDSPGFTDAIDRAREAGIGGVLLFGGARRKSETASEASAADGALQRALARARDRAGDLVLIADLCLCAYTANGHCWLGNGRLDREATLEALARAAVSLARAGADVLAPSGMVDGMVRAVRTALDAAGFADRAILSYAVKYASALYAPFRDAAANAPASGDRRGYQMDPANVREALHEARLDASEGADWLMVKPALTSLDVIRAVRESTSLPLAAYSVSGEYAMVKAAARAGWLDERATTLEMLLAMRRAGADALITYHAVDAAGWLAEERR
jgi:porphobilinogen synthase